MKGGWMDGRSLGAAAGLGRVDGAALVGLLLPALGRGVDLGIEAP